MSAGALHYTANDLAAAKHTYELTARDETIVTIDYAQRGLGNASCGPGPLDQYKLKSEPVAFSYSIRPVKGPSADISEMARVAAPLILRPRISCDDEGMITLTSNTSDAGIFYTLDADASEKEFKKYEKPFDVSRGGTVRAYAVRKGMIDSLTAQKSFRMMKKGWEVVYVDSVHAGDENKAANAIDGNPNTFWHTNWDTNVNSPLPHEIHVDMGRPATIKAVTYLPRQSVPNGRIGKYQLYLSKDGQHWGKPVREGKFENTGTLQTIELGKSIECRFIRLVALSEVRGNFFTSVAEIGVIQN
jgi:beta-galactosidase